MNATDLISNLRSSLADAKAQGNFTVPIVGLETYLADMEQIAKDHSTTAVQEAQQNEAKNKFNLEVWKIRAPMQNAINLEMFKSVIEAGQTALKSAIIINGGAAIALLAFAGNRMTNCTALLYSRLA